VSAADAIVLSVIAICITVLTMFTLAMLVHKDDEEKK
jgi:hypothetical protein